MNKYEQFILSCINESGYILGKELNTLLQKKFSVTSVSGRKIIQRAVNDSKIIKSSSPITFGNGQYAYLSHDKSLTREILLKISKKYRPALYRILRTLDKNRGIISLYDLRKIASVPVQPGISKSDSTEKLINELRNLRLVEEVQDDNGTFYLISPSVRKKANSLMIRQYNNMKIDAMFVPDIIRSLQRFNLINTANILYRNKQNCSENIYKENLYWDATAYSKSTGINPVYGALANTVEKQSLVVLDIVISRSYTQEDLDGFLSRIQTMTNSSKQGKKKVLPIVIYSELESVQIEATLRKLGFICFDLGSIYGSKIYKIIQNLIQLQRRENTETGEIKESEKEIEDILKSMRLAGQEDNLNSIKGDLFEFLLFPLLKLIYPDCSIVHGRKIKEQSTQEKRQLEFDYIINSYRKRECTVFELKGYSTTNIIPLGEYTDRNTIKWFFSNTFPVAKNKLLQENPGFRITACYVTTSKFRKDGELFLENMKGTKLYPSEVDIWYDGEKLLKLLKEKNLTDVSNVIEKYYITEG
jgi:hypothetical protein